MMRSVHILGREVKKMTPLHLIASTADYTVDLRILEILVKRGADINKEDSEGWTPYARCSHMADSQTGDHVMSFFRERGAQYKRGTLDS
jgi:hypothetical protein